MKVEAVAVVILAGVLGAVVLRRAGVTRRWFEVLLVGAAVAVAACVTVWPSGLWLLAVPLGAFGLPAAVVDLAEHRIPNQVSALLLGFETVGIAGVALVSDMPEMLLRAVAGGAVWAGLLLGSFVISGQPGPGDVKFAPSLGMLAGAAGWSAIGAAIASSYLVAGFAALVFVAAGRRRSRIPLAPAMVGGTVLAVTLTSLAS